MDLLGRLLFACLIVAAPTFAAAQVPQGSFVGILPCADCPAIDHRLDLFADGVYYLRRTYREREDGRFDEIGTWTLASDHQTLVLKSGREAPLRFSIDDADKLTLLDREGRWIDSPFNHAVYRSDLLSPIAPRLTMQGMFTYFADSATFHECRTGRRMPVAMEGDYIRLERAWLEAGRSMEQPLFAELEGTIIERVNMEGPARPMVVVERLVGVTPDGTCPDASAEATFDDTYWRLTEVLGKAVFSPERQREAHLVFQSRPATRVSGSTGCNRIGGQFERRDETLRFLPLAGTKMACMDVMEQENRFIEALNRTRGWRIDRRDLELLDEYGVILARFEATRAP